MPACWKGSERQPSNERLILKSGAQPTHSQSVQSMFVRVFLFRGLIGRQSSILRDPFSVLHQ